MSRAILSSLSGAGARRAAVDDEIDEEFALHLDLLERDLIESGVDPRNARRQAAARFGDIETFRARCRRIALKEQIMLERINTVALVLVVAGMVYLALRVEATQSRTAAAITAIAQRLEPPAASPPTGARVADPAPSVQPIYINTGVARPGTYALLDENMTLRRMLIAAGGLTPTAGAEVIVVHSDGDTETILGSDLDNPLGPDIGLRPGDRIEIR
jgi:hypothetical protein